ncbi:hypothetical protein [Okeania sp. SIO2B3]|uniref:hypothetical protein n=1 Tax=Okeania sp. SIO2B3 TaxID=2607784 RepID=UPI0013C0D0B7|nr:hypothetical protein [Okeania sp. SIO2B3]NET43645.1 hypothetical protein [Okeania sp. SIO2B3]
MVKKVSMGRWGDGEMGRWGDGEMGRWGDGGGWQPTPDPSQEGKGGEMVIKHSITIDKCY